MYHIACGGIGRGRPVSQPPPNLPGQQQQQQGFHGADQSNRSVHFGRNPSGGGGDAGGFGQNNTGSGARTCHNCGEGGHLSRECSKPRSDNRNCFNCNKPGHLSRDCPDKAEGGGGGGFTGFGAQSAHGGFNDAKRGFATGSKSDGGFERGPKLCNLCKEEGHLISACPKLFCFNCKKYGHFSKDCSQERRLCKRCGEPGHFERTCTGIDAGKSIYGEKDDGEPTKVIGPPSFVPEEEPIDKLWKNHIQPGADFVQHGVQIHVTGADSENAIYNQYILPIAADFPAKLCENIKAAGTVTFTPIQRKAMPYIVHGRDLMGCARTGSGKTAAYLLPIMADLIRTNKPAFVDINRISPVAFILVPTRELVKQVKDECRKFANGTHIKICRCYGGTDERQELLTLRSGCHILVATPGRLMKYIQQNVIGFGKCKYLVLDEADKMLDLGFEPEVRLMAENAELPPKSERQTLMFSATFPNHVQQMANDFLENHIFVTVGRVLGGANECITQRIELVERTMKKEKLLEILREHYPKPDISDTSDKKKEIKRTIIFVERKRYADYLASIISEDVSLPLAISIHGDRYQEQREIALKDFKSDRGMFPILVATSLASRGLDIVGVHHVIVYDLPEAIEDYVHRIGRTGRNGNVGLATAFFDPCYDTKLAPNLVKILSDARQEVPDWLQKVAGVQEFAAADQPQDPFVAW